MNILQALNKLCSDLYLQALTKEQGKQLFSVSGYHLFPSSFSFGHSIRICVYKQ